MNQNNKRYLDVVVISDVHLGTYGCRSKELLQYLKSINPKTLILNGDIIDIWQFKKSYFPKAHLKVVKHLMGLVTTGTTIYYVTGNHDEMLRKFTGFRIGNFEIVNKVVLKLDNEKAWFFHGDVFDISMKHSKWMARLGGKGYDLLIRLNTAINWMLESIGKERISFSKKIKQAVKSAVKHIDDFEKTAAEIAMMNGYHYVVCGHIHNPQIKLIKGQSGKSTTYLNSGDWVENLTALEYIDKKWSLYKYKYDQKRSEQSRQEGKIQEYDSVDLHPELLLKEVISDLGIKLQVS